MSPRTNRGGRFARRRLSEVASHRRSAARSSTSTCPSPSPRAATCSSKCGRSRSIRSTRKCAAAPSREPAGGRCSAGTSPERSWPVGPGAKAFNRATRCSTPARSPARRQCRVPSRRRAPRRPQAGQARLDRGGGAAADLDHRVGSVVRPARHPRAGRRRGLNLLLIVGGAGGVGSMAIQFARKLTDATVIATASRPETRQWALELGAHHVVDHSKPLARKSRRSASARRRSSSRPPTPTSISPRSSS